MLVEESSERVWFLMEN